jgi:mono/diheme cytochrome c family protein
VKNFALALLVLVMVGVAAAAGILYSGAYDVAAAPPHMIVAQKLLHYAMRRSVTVRAAGVAVPDLQDSQRIARGLALYRRDCQQCHGGPGVAPDPFGMGVRPSPPNLTQDGRDWPANELYWVIRHGVRMTAMPAWEFRLSETELWDLTAFVKRLPTLTPAQYQAAPATAPPPQQQANRVLVAGRGPVAATGKFLISQYMCATCHEIPGIAGADNTVGPPLAGFARRTFIAGTLRNTQDNLARWLRDPQSVRPMSAMPDLGIGDAQAQAIAAYLLTLDDPL